MSEATVTAKDSGLNAALRSPWAAGMELVKRFGIATTLAVFLLWRVDSWVEDMRSTNKATTEAFQRMAIDNARIVHESTTQSRQTQQAIEKFTEQSATNQKLMERVLDRLERSSSALFKPSGRGPVIE
jgi:hypothetical protein